MRTIDKIVIHHSISPRDQTLDKSVASFNENHKRLHAEVNSLGYHIAYHYIIAWDGRRTKTRWLDELGFHASDNLVNETSVGVCLTGNFDIEHPSQFQLETFRYLKKELESKLGTLEVHLHNEYSNKSCPGKNFNMELLNERPLEPPLTRKDVEAIVKRELLKHKLQDHETCPHGEVIPIGQHSFWSISTISWLKTIKPINGKITWNLMDQPDEVAKTRSRILFQNVFFTIQQQIGSLEFNYVDDKNAQIRLFFRKSGDPILPENFDENTLAYWVAPYEWEYSWAVYFNEAKDWSTMLDENWRRLYKVAVHEILHTLNLWHSIDSNDIMYYRYNKGEHEINFTKDTKALLSMLYL